MTDITRQFVADPVRILRREPFNAAFEYLGVRQTRIQVDNAEGRLFGQLLPVTARVPGVDFYILGWRAELSSSGFLGSAADFFFTGPLTGCTVAVDKNWARPRVIHANRTLPSGRMDVPHMMGSVNTFMAGATSWLRFWQSGPNITVVQSHVRGENDTYNIFGWRGYFGWTFYRQHCRWAGLGEGEVRGLETLDNWF
jgi:hypothetical protein